MSRCLAACLSVATLLLGPTSAQQPRDGQAALAGPTGTGAIAGVVETDASPAQPLRRAIVTLAGAPLPLSLSTITDDAGRFAFASLPVGRFTVEAAKAAYLTSAYGAERPGRAGTPIALAAGAHETIAIHLSLGAVITGTIRDDRGRPAVGAHLQLVDAQVPTRAVSGGAADTDDQGTYRMYGLPAGTYVVAALPRQIGQGEIGERSTAEIDAILAGLRQRTGRPTPTPATERAPITTAASPERSVNLAPVYFAGTATFGEATTVTVHAGEERTGVDFSIIPVATCAISGTITDTAGPLGDLQVMLVGDSGPHLNATYDTVGGGPTLGVRPGADGRFTFTNVAPGHYVLTARSRTGVTRAPETNVVRAGSTAPPRAPGEEWRYAQTDVTVDGSDISGVVLALWPGSVLSGRLIVDASPGVPAPDLTKIHIDLTGPSANRMVITRGSDIIGNNMPAPPSVTPDAEGLFEITGIAPASYTLRVSVPAALGGTWWPRSAMAGNHDLLDAPIPLALGQNLTAVVVTLTNRHTELAGTLQSPAGVPAPEYVIMAIPADRSLWLANSRRIQLARPGTDGAFSIADLPPGDYLISALTSLDVSVLYETSFLDEVAKQSVPVTIRDGSRTVQNLRVAR